MTDLPTVIASLATFDNEALAQLKKALVSEMRSRNAKPQLASPSELYQIFWDNYEEKWQGVEAPGPYRHPNPVEFEELVKRFRTSAKTPKGINAWLGRAHTAWCQSLMATYLAEKQAEEAVRSLIYRLTHETGFPKTIAWGRPIPKPEVRKIVSGSVPHLMLTWHQGSVTATERVGPTFG